MDFGTNNNNNSTGSSLLVFSSSSHQVKGAEPLVHLKQEHTSLIQLHTKHLCSTSSLFICISSSSFLFLYFLTVIFHCFSVLLPVCFDRVVMLVFSLREPEKAAEGGVTAWVHRAMTSVCADTCWIFGGPYFTSRRATCGPWAACLRT